MTSYFKLCPIYCEESDICKCYVCVKLFCCKLCFDAGKLFAIM